MTEGNDPVLNSIIREAQERFPLSHYCSLRLFRVLWSLPERLCLRRIYTHTKFRMELLRIGDESI